MSERTQKPDAQGPWYGAHGADPCGVIIQAGRDPLGCCGRRSCRSGDKSDIQERTKMSKRSKRRLRAKAKRLGVKISILKPHKRASDRIHDGDGPICKRCGEVTIRWAHHPSWRPEPSALGYYTKWYECPTQGCKTRQVMTPEFYVPLRNNVIRSATPSTHEREEEDRMAHFRII